MNGSGRGLPVVFAAAIALSLSLLRVPVPARADSASPCASAVPSCPAVNFNAPYQSALAGHGAVSAGATSMVQGDFNGDGLPDLAGVPSGGSAGATRTSGVLVMLGAPGGTFEPPTQYAAGLYPIGVATGHLRGPRAPADLVVSDAGSLPNGDYSIAVLLGKGDGTFAAPHIIDIGPAYASSVMLADLSGNGLDDIVYSTGGVSFANPQSPHELTVLMSNGDGSVGTPASYSAGAGLGFFQLAAVDLNGDGKLDIIGLDTTSLWVALGNGDGTLQPAVDAWTDPVAVVGQNDSGPQAFAVGDFNGDGHADVAVDLAGTRVDILLGTGQGTFVPSSVIDISSNQSGFGGGAMVATDLNGDGHVELAVSTGFGATLVVLDGTGLGTFDAPVYYPLPDDDNAALVAADLQRVGHPDLVVSTGFNGYFGGVNTLTLLRNRGDGTFPDPVLVPLLQVRTQDNGATPLGSTLGDFNGDGKLDLAVTLDSSPIEPLSNGQYTVPLQLNPAALTASVPGAVAVALGNGDGSFQPEKQYRVGVAPFAVRAVDVTGDGHQDLVVANAADSTISVLLGNGDGTFQTQVTFPTGKNPSAIAVGDFNGDGKPDLAFSDSGDNTVSVLINQSTPGHPAFAAPVMYSVGVGPASIVAADLDGDGHLDLAVVGGGSFVSPVSPSTYTLLMGNADGSFRAGSPQPLWDAPGASGIAAGDLRGSGHPDLAFCDFTTHQVRVLSNDGHAGFTPTATYTVGYGPQSIAIADFSGNGHPDIAVNNLNDGSINVLVNNGDGTFQPVVGSSNPQLHPYGWSSYGYPTFMAVGDINGDGLPDIAVPNIFISTATVLLNTTQRAPNASVPEAPGAALVVLGGVAVAVFALARRRRRAR